MEEMTGYFAKMTLFFEIRKTMFCEFIAAVAKVSYRHGRWLVACATKKGRRSNQNSNLHIQYI